MKWFLVYLTVMNNAPGGFGAVVYDHLPFSSLEECTAMVNIEQAKAAQTDPPLRAICAYSKPRQQ
jgi:hypothetical protein